jgi:hypothetical protein
MAAGTSFMPKPKLTPAQAIEKIRLALNCADADLKGALQCVEQWDIAALDGNTHAIRQTRDEIAEALNLLKTLQTPAPAKVVVLVYRGVVESVVATDKTLDVTVLDCDGDDQEENEAKWETISADPQYHPVH